MGEPLPTFASLLHTLHLAILRNDNQEPVDLHALRTGQISISVRGHFGTNWESAWDLLRKLPLGAWLPLVQLCEKTRANSCDDGDASHASNGSGEQYMYINGQILDLMATLNWPYLPLLRYVSFVEMGDLFDTAIVLGSTASRDELRRFAWGFLRYLNRYNAYAVLFFD